MNAILLSLSLSIGQPPQPVPPLPRPPEILFPQPGPTQGIPLPPPPLVPVKIPTLAEFAATFVPVPGIHDVMVIHPVSKRPINVVFRLPEGLPRVRTGKRTLDFDYGKKGVELIFRIGGKVDVRYD